MPLTKEKQKGYTAEWYQRNKKKHDAGVKKNRQVRVSWFDDLKKSYACDKCGESHPGCLDFHHINPSEKFWDINKMVSFAYSERRILDEIAKCVCWCSNCHRKHHWEERRC